MTGFFYDYAVGVSHHRFYICPAEDTTIGGRPLTNAEKIAILSRVKGQKSQLERGGVANGVRGRIEGILVGWTGTFDHNKPNTIHSSIRTSSRLEPL